MNYSLCKIKLAESFWLKWQDVPPILREYGSQTGVVVKFAVTAESNWCKEDSELIEPPNEVRLKLDKLKKTVCSAANTCNDNSILIFTDPDPPAFGDK